MNTVLKTSSLYYCFLIFMIFYVVINKIRFLTEKDMVLAVEDETLS